MTSDSRYGSAACLILGIDGVKQCILISWNNPWTAYRKNTTYVEILNEDTGQNKKSMLSILDRLEELSDTSEDKSDIFRITAKITPEKHAYLTVTISCSSSIDQQLFHKISTAP